MGNTVRDFFHDSDVKKEIRKLIPSSGGNTIYTANGSLNGDREIDMDGHTLTIEQDERYFLLINPLLDNEQAILAASNPANNGNFGVVQLETFADSGKATLEAWYNDESKFAKIVANANVTTGTLTYIADTHIFNGDHFVIGGTPLIDANNLVEVNHNGEILFTVDIGDHDQSALLAAKDGTGVSFLLVEANDNDGYGFTLNGNDGANTVSIVGNTVGSFLNYVANIHTFNGNISLNQILNLGVFTNSSPSDGDIWRADNTNTGLKIRINGVTKTINVS